MIEYGNNSIIVRNVKKDSKEFKNALFRFSVFPRGSFGHLCLTVKVSISSKLLNLLS